MKSNFIIGILFIYAFLISGCTQMVTAPINIASTTVCAAIDITGSAVHAVAGSSDKDEEKK